MTKSVGSNRFRVCPSDWLRCSLPPRSTTREIQGRNWLDLLVPPTAGITVIADMRLDPAAELPPEIFHEILTYLEANELARASRVSRPWYQLCNDGNLWQSLCLRRWRGKRYMRRVYRFGKDRAAPLI